MEELDGGAEEEAGDDGEEDDGDEDGRRDQPRAQGDRAEDDLLPAARGEAEAGGIGLTARKSGPDPAEAAADEFARDGEGEDERNEGQVKVGDKVHLQPDGDEEERGKDGGDESEELLLEFTGDDGGIAQRDPCDERSEDSLQAEELRDGGGDEAEAGGQPEKAGGPDEMAVHERKDAIGCSAHSGEHEDGKDDGSGEVEKDVALHAAVDEAEGDGKEDPADDVVDHGGGDDDHPKARAQQPGVEKGAYGD